MRRGPIAAALVAALISALLVTASPASADYPSFRPTFEGQRASVSGPDGTECFVAVYDWLFPYEDLMWVPAPCPEPEGEIAWGANTGIAGPRSVQIVSRIAQFNATSRIATGADAYTQYNGRFSSVLPSRLAAESDLMSFDGQSWTKCRSSKPKYNSVTNYQTTPTFHWGSACGLNRTYGTWSTGWVWTGTSWLGSTAWSGTVFLPCSFCLTASGAEVAPPGPPPMPKHAPPPPPPRRPRG